MDNINDRRASNEISRMVKIMGLEHLICLMMSTCHADDAVMLTHLVMILNIFFRMN